VKQSTRNKAKGKFHEVKGKVKEKIGRAANKPKLRAQGKAEGIRGKIQKKIGEVGKILGV
jgi:uncharacterized protein YjbJ (UPF0337 family)